MLNRRTLLLSSAMAAAGFARAGAQDYPARPIRIIVPLAAGGMADILARVIAAKLGEAGHTAVVENRTGGSGVIGADGGAGRNRGFCPACAVAPRGSMSMVMGASGLRSLSVDEWFSHRDSPLGTMLAWANPVPWTVAMPITARKMVGSVAWVRTETMPLATVTEPRTPGWPAR